MANLVIDIGNTQTKLAVFSHNEMIDSQRYQYIDTNAISTVLKKYRIDKAIVSSVKRGPQDWENDLKGQVKVYSFDSDFVKSIHNHYRTPQTLGADRLAAVVGAHNLYPKTDNLIIDGGTCITYDWVDAGGNYFGGSISPGLNMRYKALNHYTGALPLLNENKEFNSSYGDDTATAITSGVQNGIKYELVGFIDSYSKPDQKMNIILTGGDNVFFDTLLKNSIFAPYIKKEPNLVLKGLNAAIEHND
ncbi:type III pantothenate kinase [Mucilaginibacter auburnensis]|uniref:Type III pantothenate kinase n=1 Tax=Mucilaginibacter auburnensis TaxID=1457233 RepID=A0A2H9VT29_9SPHI|nr:type III pantothenate kinase [Mucilaginibacter auburnensis]PJJ83968.1 type III pantothenate kinase [Mucilaginibacter auburnensis]